MNSLAMRTAPEISTKSRLSHQPQSNNQFSSFKSRKTQEKKGGSSYYILLIIFIALVIIGIGIYFAIDSDSVSTGTQTLVETGSLQTLDKIRDSSNQTVPSGTKTITSGKDNKVSSVKNQKGRSKSKIVVRKSNKGKTSNSLLSPGRGQKIFKVKRK